MKSCKLILRPCHPQILQRLRLKTNYVVKLLLKHVIVQARGDKGDHYSLKWDYFEDNLLQGLWAERARGEFVDVGLAVAGGEVLHAHKIVLSLSSTFF